MKTLKKTLCLVLAVVMVVGVLIIPAGAADYDDFTDKDAIEHKEAVSVLTGLGIIEGTGSGFDPNGKLNRAAGAVLIARMLATPANAKNLPVTKPFDDVESAGYGWAAEGISYGVENGYISGHGNGKFDPAGALTGYQLAKMLLVGIGYADASKYNGDGYETRVYVDAVETGMFDHLTNPAKGLTRDEAAQMLFVGLTYTEEGAATGKFTVEVGDTHPNYDGLLDGQEFESRTEVILVMKTLYPDAAATEYTIVPLTDNKGSFGDKTYDGLRKVSRAADPFGRTTTKWVNGDEDDPKTVAELTNDAAKVYTAKASEATIKADFKGYTVNGNTLKVDATNDSVESIAGIVYHNSASAAALQLHPSDYVTIAKAISDLTSNSSVVYVYTSKKVITKIVAIDTYAGTVTDVDTDDEGETTTTITEKDGVATVSTTEASGVKENDIVLYTKADDEVQTVELASKFTGTLKSYTSSNKFSINSKTYELAAEVADQDVDNALIKANINKEMVYYTGRNNAIVFTDTVAGDSTVITDYAIVLQDHVDANSDHEWYESGNTTYTVSLQVLKSDGSVGVYDVPLTKASAAIAQSGANANGDAITAGDYYFAVNGVCHKVTGKSTGAGTFGLSGVYTYVVSGDNITLREQLTDITGSETASGTYVGEIADTQTINNKSAVVQVANTTTTSSALVNNVVVNNSTVFILSDGEGGYAVKKGVSALSGTTVTGTAGAANKEFVVVNVTHPTSGSNTYVAKYVIATGIEFAEGGATPVDAYVYIDGNNTATMDGDTLVYTYEAIGADGETIELTGTASVPAGIYKYKSDGSIDETTAQTNVKKEKVTSVLDGVVVLATSGAYRYSDANVVGNLKAGSNVCALVDPDNNAITILFVL